MEIGSVTRAANEPVKVGISSAESPHSRTWRRGGKWAILSDAICTGSKAKDAHVSHSYFQDKNEACGFGFSRVTGLHDVFARASSLPVANRSLGPVSASFDQIMLMYFSKKAPYRKKGLESVDPFCDALIRICPSFRKVVKKREKESDKFYELQLKGTFYET